MDGAEKFGIKIPNSVVIVGFTKTEKEGEILDFMSKYGPISKTQVIDEPKETNC